MSTKKDNWFKRNYFYLRNTITPMDPEDSKYERFKKKLEFGFFAILLSCGTLAIVLAASFAH